MWMAATSPHIVSLRVRTFNQDRGDWFGTSRGNKPSVIRPSPMDKVRMVGSAYRIERIIPHGVLDDTRLLNGVLADQGGGKKRNDQCPLSVIADIEVPRHDARFVPESRHPRAA